MASTFPTEWFDWSLDPVVVAEVVVVDEVRSWEGDREPRGHPLFCDTCE